MLLKQHLDMIGRNEPIQRKARFWQSYVRALKDEPEYLAEDAWDAHARRLEAIDELLPLSHRNPHCYRPRSTSVPPPPRSSSVPPTRLRSFSRARSVTPAPPHLRDIIEEEPALSKPTYTYTGQKLSDVSSSSSFDAEMSKAVTSYSSGSNLMNVTTKKTRTYIPIRSTRINSDIIHAYMTRNDVYNWPGWLLQWA